jgi:hypothetical protein
MPDGAPVGRGFWLPIVPSSSLEEVAKRVREAAARGDVELARNFIDQAARRGRRTGPKR